MSVWILIILGVLAYEILYLAIIAVIMAVDIVKNGQRRMNKFYIPFTLTRWNLKDFLKQRF